MEPLISVIVPIYNVKAYLDRCVESLRGQSYKDSGNFTGGRRLDRWLRESM